MKQIKTFFYLIFVIVFMFNCVKAQDKPDVKMEENWMTYRQKISDNPKFSTELEKFQKEQINIYKKNFSYDEYRSARKQYLENIKSLIESNKSDSLKLAVLTSVLASDSYLNSKEKKSLFNQINTNIFSDELVDHYRGYLGTPKYQIGDKLDVEKIYSYKTKSEISLPLASKTNIIFFWSSWCANCYRYYKPIDNLIEKYGASQLNVIGISLDQKEKRMKRYENKHAFRFASFSDLDTKWKSANAEKFGVVGIPVCLVVNDKQEILLVNPQSNYLELMVDWIVEKNRN